jgi:hypothetical protein
VSVPLSRQRYGGVQAAQPSGPQRSEEQDEALLFTYVSYGSSWDRCCDFRRDHRAIGAQVRSVRGQLQLWHTRRAVLRGVPQGASRNKYDAMCTRSCDCPADSTLVWGLYVFQHVLHWSGWQALLGSIKLWTMAPDTYPCDPAVCCS